MKKHEIPGPILFEKIDYINPYDFSEIHRHSYFELMLFATSSAKGVNSIDFKDYVIREKSLHIVAPNQSHLLQRSLKDNGIMIQFTKEFLMNNHIGFHPEWLFSLQSNPVTELSKEQFKKLNESMLELGQLIQRKGTFNYHITMHYFYHLMFQILEILQINSSTLVSPISLKFIELVEKQFKTNRIVACYADSLKCSIKRLNSEFKKSMGMTPLQYIHQELVIEIKRLVLIEKFSHKEIAYELNFDSPASYSRFVKKHMGCTPTEIKFA